MFMSRNRLPSIRLRPTRLLAQQTLPDVSPASAMISFSTQPGRNAAGWSSRGRLDGSYTSTHSRAMTSMVRSEGRSPTTRIIG